jgi:hypothetical protein
VPKASQNKLKPQKARGLYESGERSLRSVKVQEVGGGVATKNAGKKKEQKIAKSVMVAPISEMDLAAAYSTERLAELNEVGRRFAP